MMLTKMQLKKTGNQNLFLTSNLKNDLKRSFFVYYYTTFAVALFVLCYLFFFEEGQGFKCVYKTVYNKECSTCGLTRDLHSIFINHKNTILNQNSIFYAILLMVNLITRPIMILTFKKLLLKYLILVEFLMLTCVFILFIFIST